MRYILLIVLISGGHVYSQTFAIKADRMITSGTDKDLVNPVILVYKDKIIDINSTGHIPDSAEIIDLSGYTILPGLIDVHTHLLHDGGSYNDNLYNLSTSFKAIRAVSFLDISLNNGFTTLRDVCTEGAGYADVDLAKAVDQNIISGPRIFPSSRGIATTGQYVPRPRRQNWEIDLPAGTKYVSGVDECRREAREQISKGATWLKVFADWTVVSFTEAELSAITDEAKRFKVNVAAHATTREGIALAIKTGVRSIEHGAAFDEILIQEALKAGVFWCPTMSYYEHSKTPSGDMYFNLKKAYRMGLKIVLGTDVGSFPWTINQAKELEYYVTLIGMKPRDAIKSGTMYPAELLGKENELGQLAKGYLADIIAVKGNPVDDITLLQKVSFVMKSGRVYKKP